MAFPTDRVPLKVTVYLALALETAQTALITHDSFKFFAIGFLNPEGLNQVNTGWFSIPILTGLSECDERYLMCSSDESPKLCSRELDARVLLL